MHCATVSREEIDIEQLNAKYDNLLLREFPTASGDDALKLLPLITTLCDKATTREYVRVLKRKYAFNGKNSFILDAYNKLCELGSLEYDADVLRHLRTILQIKSCKSHSGVLVITIFTSPYPEFVDNDGNVQKQSFSCAWNCAYCPNEPGQPRSYLKGEPGVMRANRNQFDCVTQMWDRMNTLYRIGHPIDKLEVIVLGGTWTSYPVQYRDAFCRDIYYAANTFGTANIFGTANPFQRNRLSLEEEVHINRTAHTRVIGLTLETRPDTINADELRRFRRYGCTRVQLGLQHIDHNVLRKIERRCTYQDITKAISLLKNCGFKVDSHWMPNLPGSSYDTDRNMFLNELLGTKHPVPTRKLVYNKDLGMDVEWEEWKVASPYLQTDQWKIYPCAIVPWTQIETWYKCGEYVPYDASLLERLLIDTCLLTFPWIRLNRIIRDIPSDYIYVDPEMGNARQDIEDKLRKEGQYCQCIRCREIKGSHWDGTYVLRVRKYDASSGKEFFISAESHDAKQLYGFLRLRICLPATFVFPELEGCALIRELHVYGHLQPQSSASGILQGLPSQNRVQHMGLGKLLLQLSECVAKQEFRRKITVIAGEGTREYYAKSGYMDLDGEGRFMVKLLE
jgi:histone acetyltransferase (RNA polymerase elongator complex component)